LLRDLASGLQSEEEAMEEKKRSAGSRKAVLVATLGLACGAAAVMLVAARRPMASGDMASLNVPSPEVGDSTAAPASVTTETAASPSAAPLAAAPAPKVSAAKKPMAKAPVSAPGAAAVKPSLEEPVAKAPTHEAIAAMPAAREEAPRPAAAEIQTASVTINGCLEREGNVFRLKNVDGEDAPKSRSWRSGFLRKGKSKIDIVDATNNRLKLTDHVGHRVTITGMLEDREMQARAITRVAPYCE
jgi:hypothetical protein